MPQYYFKVITGEEEVTDGSRGRDESERQRVCSPFFFYVQVSVTESQVNLICPDKKGKRLGEGDENRTKACRKEKHCYGSNVDRRLLMMAVKKIKRQCVF